MRLVFEKQFISEELYKELGFDDFLSLFNIEMPLFSEKALRFHPEESGKAHFERLSKLQKLIENHKLDIEGIISLSRKLPPLEFILPAFENGKLEQFHLFSLGIFVTENSNIQKLETHSPLPANTYRCCSSIQAVLENHTQNNFSGLRLTTEEQSLQDRISNCQNQIKNLLLSYEKDIYNKTGLSMIYPFPKELLPDDNTLSTLQECHLLQVVELKETFRIDYKLPLDIGNMVTNKKALIEQFEQAMQLKLEKVNEELSPFYDNFVKAYEERTKRVYELILLSTKNRYNLSLPLFRNDPGCTFKGAELLVLKEKRGGHYIPLDIALEKGASVLFGANMAGKTTVLKTLFFHLILIKAGLPVPAESITLHYPAQVELHLKSSGNVRNSLSGFGEELNFFTKPMSENSYVLVDELFQSTDPVTGVTLSQIFLSEFTKKDMIFFCSTHYSDVLSIEDIGLYRMKDAATTSILKESDSVDKLIDTLPFTVEHVSPEDIEKIVSENRKPLYAALHFPLPEPIKDKIRKAIKGYEDGRTSH